MNRECWSPVVGFEGLYEVSDHGRVRSLDRVIRLSNGRTRKQKGREMRLIVTTTNGYSRVGVSLSRDGRTHMAKVHHLVLTAFVGPSPEGHEGCHNDGDATNNRVENLRWGTRSENVRDAIKHGTHSEVRKTECPVGHALTEDNLLPSALPKRRCWKCHNERSRRNRAKRRADRANR